MTSLLLSGSGARASLTRWNASVREELVHRITWLSEDSDRLLGRSADAVPTPGRRGWCAQRRRFTPGIATKGESGEFAARAHRRDRLQYDAWVAMTRYTYRWVVCATTLILALWCPSALAQSRADRKSTRLNSSHLVISYAVFCLKKKIRTE